MRQRFSYTPIGRIHTVFPEKFGVPRQPNLVKTARGVIELDQPAESLDGLDGFSHLWVLFDFHHVDHDPELVKIKPPRLGGKKVGVFATRSPHRPNPIGLSVLKIESIEGNKVFVSGVDIVSGTPILDIKPYISTYDSINNADNGWVSEQVENTQFDIIYDVELPDDLDRELIEGLLSLDPRPNSYKTEKMKDFEFGISVSNYNVNFLFRGNRIHVSRVTPL